jgi:uncharacterized protein YxjI
MLLLMTVPYSTPHSTAHSTTLPSDDIAHGLVGIDRFIVKQKITMMVNRYEILAVRPDGRPDRLLAVAQQKRLAFKEEVTFYADEGRRNPIFSVKARRRIDLSATYDIKDARGAVIGTLRKDFSRSLLRSTWHVESGDIRATGAERSPAVAIARRVWEAVPVLDDIPSPFVYHFDFVDQSGQVVMSSERQRTLRDRYDVTVPGARLDGRVAAATAVLLDALQSR